MVGTRRNPLSSRNPKWAPSTAVFFYARPYMLFPIPDSLFVPLSVPFVGYLTAPTHCAHQLPDIRYGVADTEASANKFADAAQCPKVGLVSGLQGTLQKQPNQALSLSLVQQRGSAGRPLRTQSSFALAPV